MFPWSLKRLKDLEGFGHVRPRCRGFAPRLWLVGRGWGARSRRDRAYYDPNLAANTRQHLPTQSVDARCARLGAPTVAGIGGAWAWADAWAAAQAMLAVADDSGRASAVGDGVDVPAGVGGAHEGLAPAARLRSPAIGGGSG